MKLLFVASDKAEASAFPPSCQFVFTGVGLALSGVILSKAICEFKPDVVINIGSVGSINHEIGSVLQIKSIYNLDQDLTCYHVPPCTTLKADRSMLGELTIAKEGFVLGSSSTFASVVTPLMKDLNLDACDMEAYSEALACKEYGIPFYSYKVVTDLIGIPTKLKEYKKQLSLFKKELVSVVLQQFDL